MNNKISDDEINDIAQKIISMINSLILTIEESQFVCLVE